MKKLLMLALVLCLACSAAFADAVIDEKTFPDKTFREEVVKAFDQDGDGKLSDKEIEAVEEIECRDKDIKTLQGVEIFTGLKRLFANGNQLTEIDPGIFPELEVLHIPGNQVTTLDVSKNPKLQDLQFAENQLTEIDLSNNPELAAFQCSGNQLTVLDVSNNPELTYIEAIANQLTELDLSKNPNLTDLYLQGNQIKELDISACPKLVELVGKIERKTEDDPMMGKFDAFNGDDLGCWMWIDSDVNLITEAK